MSEIAKFDCLICVLHFKNFLLQFKGYYTHNYKLACFVLYLKTINTLKNNIHILFLW